MLMRRLYWDCEPLQVMGNLSNEPDVAFLDSSSCGYGLGRYSILSCNPCRVFEYNNGWGVVRSVEGEARQQGDCFELLREFARDSRVDPDENLPFRGGAIGFFSYDLAWEFEKLPDLLPVDHALPQARFGWYESALVFDREAGQWWGVSLDSHEALDSLCERAVGLPRASNGRFKVSDLRSNFDRESFLESVERIRSWILDGEIYQANFAQRFEARFSGSSWALYKRLRTSNPAPYSGYLKFGDNAILSSSPERFLRVEGNRASTRPIKGTRPRGTDEAGDALQERALRESEKDRAELMMIVDLERNDLGKCCKPGSVQVEGPFALERYARVIHQTATVTGELEPGQDVHDCLRSLFPGGSITGAPKIRAMEIIETVERHKRGIYTGSIGYLSADGNADFNIAIRTMRQAGDTLLFHAGGGIVWDSDPENEYEETIHKASAMLDAIGVERELLG